MQCNRIDSVEEAIESNELILKTYMLQVVVIWDLVAFSSRGRRLPPFFWHVLEVRDGATSVVPVRIITNGTPWLQFCSCLWPRLRQSTPLQISLLKGNNTFHFPAHSFVLKVVRWKKRGQPYGHQGNQERFAEIPIHTKIFFLQSVASSLTHQARLEVGGNRWNVDTPKEEKMGCGDSITP